MRSSCVQESGRPSPGCDRRRAADRSQEGAFRSNRCLIALSIASLVAWSGGGAIAAGRYGGGPSGGGPSAPHRARATTSPYAVTILASDLPGQAAHRDPDLVNAWGLAAGPATPWCIATNETNAATRYTGAGSPVPPVVTVPGAPTGVVYNGGPLFVVRSGAAAAPAEFLFATETGLISGWNIAVPSPAPATEAITVLDRSPTGAIYKGLAIASMPGGDLLYATDFHNARVDVVDGAFNLVAGTGAFVDPRIPHRFAPFGIQNIGGTLFVTYAKQNGSRDVDVPGRGLGFVDRFDPNGRFLGRVASRGHLDSPWGLALAPPDFGSFAGDLLVGNFGNGRINAYRQLPNGRWRFHGALRGTDGTPLVIDGLWGLAFGNDGPSGPTNVLYFAAGPQFEAHGHFGRIQPAA
jgi:uncharacterized protein (TIGR03118 family)